MTESATTESTTPDPVTNSVTVTGDHAQPVEWEKKYKGLQAAYDRLQKKLESTEAQLTTTLAETEENKNKSRAHETDKAALTEQLTAAQKKVADLERDVASHRIAGERMRLIMNKYPELASFEAKGLLPPAESLEALEPKLEEFRTTLGSTIDGSVRDKIKGAAPVGGGNAKVAPRSKETIYAELHHLAGRSDPESRAKYDLLIKEWDEVQAKE